MNEVIGEVISVFPPGFFEVLSECCESWPLYFLLMRWCNPPLRILSDTKCFWPSTVSTDEGQAVAGILFAINKETKEKVNPYLCKSKLTSTLSRPNRKTFLHLKRFLIPLAFFFSNVKLSMNWKGQVQLLSKNAKWFVKVYLKIALSSSSLFTCEDVSLTEHHFWDVHVDQSIENAAMIPRHIFCLALAPCSH